MAKLRKAELEAMVALLDGPNGYETPEDWCQALVDELDRLRGERDWFYGAYILAGIPGAIGPFSTKGQAKKALDKHGADKAWVIPGHTAEGLDRLMRAVDEKPERKSIEDAKADGNFWAKAFAIKEGEATGIVAEVVKVVRLSDLS